MDRVTVNTEMLMTHWDLDFNSCIPIPSSFFASVYIGLFILALSIVVCLVCFLLFI